MGNNFTADIIRKNSLTQFIYNLNKNFLTVELHFEITIGFSALVSSLIITFLLNGYTDFFYKLLNL